MKVLRFLDSAREEVLAETRYYSEIDRSLGRRFATAIDEATQRALIFPSSGAPAEAQTRKIATKGFPFFLVYRAEDREVIVFALAHHARRPGYWLERLSGKD